MDNYFYAGVFVPLTVAIPLSIAAYRHSVFDLKVKILTLYLVFDGISNVIYYTLSLFHINNMVVSHVFTVIELVLLSVFYVKNSDNRKLIRFMPLVTILFMGAAIANIFLFQNIQSYNSYTRSIEALIIIILSVNNFIRLLENAEKTPKNYVPEVYFTSGILLYFSGAFFIFVIFNIFDIKPTLVTLLWNTHATFLLLMYLLFAIGLWKYNR